VTDPRITDEMVRAGVRAAGPAFDYGGGEAEEQVMRNALAAVLPLMIERLAGEAFENPYPPNTPHHAGYKLGAAAGVAAERARVLHAAYEVVGLHPLPYRLTDEERDELAENVRAVLSPVGGPDAA
jgi:hypothetical protein